MTVSSGTNTAPIAVPPAGRYTIDPDRSEITFRTRHVFGLAPVRGSFAVHGGQIDIAAPLERSRTRADIDAASVHTGNGTRDESVRSGRYLHVAEHPLIVFAADTVRQEGGAWTVPGQLTVRGVTRPTVLDLLACSCAGGTLEARASTRVDRREFGITAQPGMTGRYLDLTLLVVARLA